MTSLLIIKTIKTIPTITTDYTIFWKWAAIIEFIIILILILKNSLQGKISNRRKFKKESIEQDIDFDNIFNSSFNSKVLYDELKVKCHPDLFVGDEIKQQIAETIFKEITKNKNNAKRLLELKNEATISLNLKF